MTINTISPDLFKKDKLLQTKAISNIRTIINGYNGYNYEAIVSGIKANLENVEYMTRRIDILRGKEDDK